MILDPIAQDTARNGRQSPHGTPRQIEPLGQFDLPHQQEDRCRHLTASGFRLGDSGLASGVQQHGIGDQQVGPRLR